MASRKLVILRAAKDELRGFCRVLRARGELVAFSETWSWSEVFSACAGRWRSRSALNLRFRVSRLGGARRVCVRISPRFSHFANFLRDGPRPVGAPRLARWPIYSPIGFLGLSATRARAHSRVDAGRLAIWDRFDAACRTYLVRNAAFIYSFVRLQKPHLGLGLGSDPRFSLLQALFGRPMRKKETRRRIGFSRKPVLAKKPQLVSARVSTRRC